MNPQNDKIVIEIPTLNQIQKRLEVIERKLEKLTQIVEQKESENMNKSVNKKIMTLNELSDAYGMSIWSLRYKASRREIPLIRIQSSINISPNI